MNVITPEKSELIGILIFLQGWRFELAADHFTDPWGRAQRERLQRIARERFRACLVGER
jgi:hypothetical protein